MQSSLLTFNYLEKNQSKINFTHWDVYATSLIFRYSTIFQQQLECNQPPHLALNLFPNIFYSKMTFRLISIKFKYLIASRYDHTYYIPQRTHCLERKFQEKKTHSLDEKCFIMHTYNATVKRILHKIGTLR